MADATKQPFFFGTVKFRFVIATFFTQKKLSRKIKPTHFIFPL